MIKGQSKLSSFLEANTNTFVGFFLTLFISPAAYHLVGMVYTFRQLWTITAIFTIISIIRGYVIRRWFNKKEQKQDTTLLAQLEYWKQFALNDENENVKALKLIHGYRNELRGERALVETLTKTVRSQSVQVEAYHRDVEMLEKSNGILKDSYTILNKKYTAKLQELEAAKQAYQHFVADAVENGYVLEEPINQSIKREDDCTTHEDGEYGTAREGGINKCF